MTAGRAVAGTAVCPYQCAPPPPFFLRCNARSRLPLCRKRWAQSSAKHTVRRQCREEE